MGLFCTPANREERWAWGAMPRGASGSLREGYTAPPGFVEALRVGGCAEEVGPPRDPGRLTPALLKRGERHPEPREKFVAERTKTLPFPRIEGAASERCSGPKRNDLVYRRGSRSEPAFLPSPKKEGLELRLKGTLEEERADPFWSIELMR